jgi:hypothetical protein
MSKQLIDLVLPRLAKTLYRELKRFKAGHLDETEFSECFENLVQRQHEWLIAKGVPEVRAALALHSAVLVLSSPGLRSEAAEQGIPVEIMEFKAIQEAAADVAENYGVNSRRAAEVIGNIVSRFGPD